MKIVVLEGNAAGQGVSWDGLHKYGDVTVYPGLSQKEVREKIADADVIVPNKLVIDESVLAGSKVRLVCEAATGYNNIDIAYCKAHGIQVTNVRNYSTDSVAQHTMALVLAVSERLAYYDRYVKDGSYAAGTSFSHVAHNFHELAGKTFGIVGLGNIGRRVAQMAEVFGCQVIYYSASGRSYDVPYTQVSFDELLTSSDILTVHCPLTEQTRHLFTYDAFVKMKPEAVFVNVARGSVVCEADLARAVEEEQIAGAGLDVFETEPMPVDSPLLSVHKQDHLVMVPHIGWGALEARQRLIADIEHSISCFMRGENIPAQIV